MLTTNIRYVRPLLTQDARSLLKRAERLVGVAEQWRSSADKVLYWATCSVNDLGGSPYNDRALALVDRCFKVCTLHSKSKMKNNIDLIQKSFRSIGGFYNMVRGSKGYLSVGPPIRPDDIAYAQVNGWKNGDKKGLTFVIAKCKNQSDLNLTDIIMHESVHFAAGIGHYNIGGKPAYGTKVFSLTHSQAMQNASSYAYLAYLARMPHTQWLNAT